MYCGQSWHFLNKPRTCFHLYNAKTYGRNISDNWLFITDKYNFLYQIQIHCAELYTRPQHCGSYTCWYYWHNERKFWIYKVNYVALWHINLITRLLSLWTPQRLAWLQSTEPTPLQQPLTSDYIKNVSFDQSRLLPAVRLNKPLIL
jgi:hypothetical protein